MEDAYDWSDDDFRNATRVSPAQMIRRINQQQGRAGGGGVTVVVPNSPGATPGVQVVPQQPMQTTALAPPISQIPPWAQVYPQAPGMMSPGPFGGGWAPPQMPWPSPPRCGPWGAPYYGSPWRALKMVGVAVDMLGQLGAAFLVPVPQAPQPSGQDSIDTENHIRYQAALAQHAKTDERIRTACKVVREALDLGHSQMTDRQ
jgi:hypothetical protein